ncbi:MAG TPA: ABC transporter permease, partial [Vicinamibacteria bacterium]|nr:ABC transporter permease [Vicinamibacteria bacterium]
MKDIALDLKVALRTFAKNPGFSAVVVLTLALGIGANTAIFTLMDQVLLRALPVKRADRMVVIDAPGPFSGMSSQQSGSVRPLSHLMFERLRDANDVFDGMLGHYAVSMHVTVEGQTESADGDLVTGGYFDTLGLEPAVGRLFTPADDKDPGAHPVVVLSHGYWSRRFGADPGVVGRTIQVNSHPMTVIGVAPKGFHGVDVGESVDVYLPMMMHKHALPTWPRGLRDWRSRFLITMARLEDGVTIEQATARINGLYAQLLQEDYAAMQRAQPSSFRDRFLQKKLVLIPGGRGPSGLRDQSKTPLLVLMGMVGLVLLIACANVANLLLARASARQKEIAVRLALGASRGRLVRQMLVESVVFALVGGALGVAFAVWTSGLLLRALPFDDATAVLTADPDLRVGLFALVLSVVTGILFGLVPALQATRPQIAPVLKDQAGAVVGGSAPFRLRKGLVVAQIALSLLLLVGAGLFTRSLVNLRNLNPGFRPERLIAFAVDPALNGYEPARRQAVLRQIREAISAEPGVQS